MRDQVLSIDQMKHLKDLDIDTSEATLYWTRHCHGCKIDDDSTGEWFLSLQKEFQVIGFISYDKPENGDKLIYETEPLRSRVFYVRG